MTDDELTAWLRQEKVPMWAGQLAANRIEELVKERDEALGRLDYWVEAQPEKDREYREEQVARQMAEAKLAKAVDVMTALQNDMLERSRIGKDTIYGNEYRIVNAGRTAWADFCAVLAELEGK